MKAYTDYPLPGIDIPHKKAPIREVLPISYDHDKYVTVEWKGQLYELKAGYLYSESGRCGDVPKFPVKTLPLTKF